MVCGSVSFGLINDVRCPGGAMVWSRFSRKGLTYLIPQTLHRGGNSATAPNKLIRRKPAYRHNWRTAQKTAELDHLTYIFAGDRNNAHGGGLVIHHANGHFVRDNSGDGFRGG